MHKPNKPKSERQRNSRRDRLTAPFKQFFRSSSPRPSSSSQQARLPSLVPPLEQGDSSQAWDISGGQRGANGLWSKAYKQLPEEYKKDLDNLDKLDIIQKLFAIAKQVAEQNSAKELTLKWGDKEINVREKAEGFLSCLNKFKEIGDIVMQYDPVHAALPWAGVRFILMVCGCSSAPLCNSTKVL